MEVLAQIFPDVPEGMLTRVLNICEGSVEAASEWLCENDWQELERIPDDEANQAQSLAGEDTTEPPLPIPSDRPADIPDISELNGQSVDNNTPSDEEDEEDDDDDDEDDEDEMNMYYDSGDEGEGGELSEPRIPPLTTRTKISPTDVQGKDQRFWVAFDDQIMQKSMIELLNISLSKLAHHRVALLNSNVTDKAIAEEKLCFNGASGNVPPSPVANRGKRKHSALENDTAPGYFAYFFPVNDLDMIWRSVLHGHLLNRRFGDLLEFRSASCATTKKRDFDELLNVYTHMSRLPSIHRQQLAATGLSTELKCCLLLPCESNDKEIYRVGKNIHGLMNVPGGIFFRAGASIGPADKMLSEELFRSRATHRMRKEELAPDMNIQGSVLGYQPPKKVEYKLQSLDEIAEEDDDKA